MTTESHSMSESSAVAGADSANNATPAFSPLYQQIKVLILQSLVVILILAGDILRYYRLRWPARSPHSSLTEEKS